MRDFMDIWIWWNKMVKIWDKMLDTEDEVASESEQSDDECVDARQYREGDAALDRVLELLNWGWSIQRWRIWGLFCFAWAQPWSTIDLSKYWKWSWPSNLELTGTVGSHRVLDGSNEAIQYFSCFLLMTFFRKFENGPRKLQTKKFSDPDKNIG